MPLTLCFWFFFPLFFSFLLSFLLFSRGSPASPRGACLSRPAAGPAASAAPGAGAAGGGGGPRRALPPGPLPPPSAALSQARSPSAPLHLQATRGSRRSGQARSRLASASRQARRSPGNPQPLAAPRRPPAAGPAARARRYSPANRARAPRLPGPASPSSAPRLAHGEDFLCITICITLKFTFSTPLGDGFAPRPPSLPGTWLLRLESSPNLSSPLTFYFGSEDK